MLAQKSVEAKYNENSAVRLAIERAEKRLLAQAYLEKVYATMPSPTDNELQAYFDGNAALFAQRRFYRIQQYAFAPSVNVQKLETRVKKAKNAKAFFAGLEKDNISANARVLNGPAEKLPMALLAVLQEIPDGKGVVKQGNNGVIVIWREGSELQPISFEKAKPSINSFLIKKARENRIKQELSSLRKTANIEYVGAHKPATSVDVKEPLPIEESENSAGGAANIN